MLVLFHYTGLRKFEKLINTEYYHKNQMNISLEVIVLMASFFERKEKNGFRNYHWYCCDWLYAGNVRLYGSENLPTKEEIGGYSIGKNQ